MCRLRLLFLRMDNHCRLFPDMCINEEADAQKDERYAEPLSHIKNHVLLEADLRLLDELDEEAHTEAADEKCSDEESSVELRQPVLVHQDLEDSKEEVAEGLVKLGRMLRFGLAAELEDEAPREACHVTVNLRIEEVAQTDECGREADSYCKMIKNPYEIEVIFPAIMPCKPPHCDEEGYSSSMTGESALPWHEYLPETLPAAEIIVRLIEETMSETGTHDGTDQQCIEKRIQQCFRNAFSSEESSENEPSENESRNEKQRVPPYRKGSDAEKLRTHMPVYHQCLEHNLVF